MAAQSANFVLLDDGWNRTMGDYIRASSRDAADAMNRTMNNFAVIAHGKTKLAQKQEIENVQSLEWWPKYVAAAMVRRKAKALAKRIEKNKVTGKTYQRLSALHYTRLEARAASARIIRSRSVAVGFVRFFFVSLSRAMRNYIVGARVPPAKTFKGFDVSIQPATVDQPSVSARVTYEYRRRGERPVKRAEALLQEIIDETRPALIDDMREYIARKAQERAGVFG